MNGRANWGTLSGYIYFAQVFSVFLIYNDWRCI